MKQCPQCNSLYTEEGERFCARDGSPLVNLSQAAGGFASLPVSPSEIVLLFGEQFAPQGEGVSNVSVAVPISGDLVDARQLAHMMLSAAVLGGEQAGSIYLQVGTKPGIRGGTCLNISPGPIRNVRWQQWSLEHRLCQIANQGVTRQFSHVVKQLWPRDFKRKPHEAWIHSRILVLQGLAARNLISAPPDFSVVQVAPALADLPASETVEPLQSLFGEVSGHRRQIWAALQEDIADGLGELTQARVPIMVFS